MQLFYKIIASGVEVNFNTYSILLKNLLAAGNWRKYIEVILLYFLLNFNLRYRFSYRSGVNGMMMNFSS